jgi:hypothetical protein
MAIGQLIGLTDAAAAPALALGDPSATAPVLSWTSGGGQIYLEIDAIPTFLDSNGGTVTDFALEDGSSVAEHYIRKPKTLKLQVNQTPTPITRAANKQVDETMEETTQELRLEPNKFQPTGLLLLTTGAVSLATSAINAIGSATGLGAIAGPPPLTVKVLTAKTDVDRINALYDDLEKARQAAALFSLDWLGRSWTNLVLEQMSYGRNAGKILAIYDLDFKVVSFVKTAQAQSLQIPAELTMKPNVPAGNKPGKKLTGAAKVRAIDSLPPTAK